MRSLIILLYFLPQLLFAQDTSVELPNNWQFRKAGDTKWLRANVPGTVHTDLLLNQLITDPFYRDNESKLQWIDLANWEYQTVFNVPSNLFAKKNIELNFEGLDTYATVYLNGILILQANNMFREWSATIKPIIKRTHNVLRILFSSAQKKVDSIAKARLPIQLPDNNRVYVRKAQFQFGWDWGPKFVGCGIWKQIQLKGWNGVRVLPAYSNAGNNVKLIQQNDSTGTSFYFEKDGKPIYIKGANWIPADIFLPRLKKNDYRILLQNAKDANMNMLRVWGGGIYESDDFYELCDSMGIMVWQDFMFAGGMYPGDKAFLNNVREEVKFQIERLRKYACIVVWCGNNEIDEAWHNWGWQQQFNLHGADSLQIWNDYERLFKDSLKKWVNEFDGKRAYISTSPKNGWGHKESFKEGDSHYWGLWWGLEDWEIFETKTGRFISEYGMQSMANWQTIKTYTDSTDRYLNSPVVNFHQKANDGFKKLNHYLTRYFIDSAKLNNINLEEYTYLTQCLQYYILKNSIAIHRSKYPINMGTLLWQFNDCWPVTSWSITDYSSQPKAAWYAVREAYREDLLPVKDSIDPIQLKLDPPLITYTIAGNTIKLLSNAAAKYVELSIEGNTALFTDNYFDMKKGEIKIIKIQNKYLPQLPISTIKIKTLYDVFNKK